MFWVGPYSKYSVCIFCNRDSLTMMQLHSLLCSFTLRKLASIWPRPGDGGRNMIGQRAIVNVPRQRRGNITLCAVISLQGLLHHHVTLGPYNTAHMITFPNTLHNAVAQDGAEQPRFVVIWDNVPPGCSGPGLVHKPQYLYSFVLAPLFSISQSHWGIIFSLPLESVSCV